MAEVAGILLAVPSLVAEGIKLSKILYVFAHEVSDARTEAHAIAKEVDMTAMLLEDFERSVGAHAAGALVTPHWQEETKRCIEQCRATYGDLKCKLIKAVPGIDFDTEDTDAPAQHAKSLAMRKRDQFKWPFTRTGLAAIGARLEKTKADLHFVATLMINVHFLNESKAAAERRACERVAENERQKINQDLLRLELRRVALQAQLADIAMHNPDSAGSATRSAGEQRMPLLQPGQNFPSWIFESNSRKSTASVEPIRKPPPLTETKAGASSQPPQAVMQQQIAPIASDAVTEQEKPIIPNQGMTVKTSETELALSSKHTETQDVASRDPLAENSTSIEAQQVIPLHGGMITNQDIQQSPVPSVSELGSKHAGKAGNAPHVQQELDAAPVSQSETQHLDSPKTPAVLAEDPEASAGLQEPAMKDEIVARPQNGTPHIDQRMASKRQSQSSEPPRRRLRDLWKTYQENHAKKASAKKLDADLRDSRNQFEARQWNYNIVSEAWEDERLAVSRADIIRAVEDFRAKDKSFSKHYARLDHHIQRSIQQRLKEKNENIVEPWKIASIRIEPKRARLEDIDAVKIVFWWQGSDDGVDQDGQQSRSTHFHPIHFKDAVGREFSFPWHLANTWDGIHGLICEAFNRNEGIEGHVRDAHYDLWGPNGQVILRSIWADVIRPGWTIDMYLWESALEQGKNQQEMAPGGQVVRSNQPEIRVAPVMVPKPPPELFIMSKTKKDEKRPAEAENPWASLARERPAPSNSSRLEVGSDDLRGEVLAACEERDIAEAREEMRRLADFERASAEMDQRAHPRQSMKRNIRKEKNPVDPLEEFLQKYTYVRLDDHEGPE